MFLGTSACSCQSAAEPRYRALATKKGMVECQRRGDIVAVLPRLELAAVDVVVYPRHVDVLHGEGKIFPAATRNNTTRNPAVSGSRRQLQEALRWQQYQTKPHHDKPTQTKQQPYCTSCAVRLCVRDGRLVAWGECECMLQLIRSSTVWPLPFTLCNYPTHSQMTDESSKSTHISGMHSIRGCTRVAPSCQIPALTYTHTHKRRVCMKHGT